MKIAPRLISEEETETIKCGVQYRLRQSRKFRKAMQKEDQLFVKYQDAKCTSDGTVMGTCMRQRHIWPVMSACGWTHEHAIR